ncbi:hypothetical protein H1R20_g13696, partial [Candolleomyces eurysporus]
MTLAVYTKTEIDSHYLITYVRLYFILAPDAKIRLGSFIGAIDRPPSTPELAAALALLDQSEGRITPLIFKENISDSANISFRFWHLCYHPFEDPPLIHWAVFTATRPINRTQNPSSFTLGRLRLQCNKDLSKPVTPGLDFPGILTIGPSFYIDAKASATLDINADLNVGLNYKIEKASMVFPLTSKYAVKQGGAFQFVDTPLKLSATPSFQTNGRVEAHLIPGIDLGINVLNGAGVASVYLNVDAGAQMNLALEGQATGEVIVGRGETREIEEAGDTVVKREPTPVAIAPTATATGSAGFSGCFDISTGLDVVAGATAKLFNIFDKSTTYTLFSRDWELYKKCFGAQTKREELDYHVRSVPEPVALNKRLVCPIAGFPPLQSLVDSMILASAVKQI